MNQIFSRIFDFLQSKASEKPDTREEKLDASVEEFRQTVNIRKFYAYVENNLSLSSIRLI